MMGNIIYTADEMREQVELSKKLVDVKYKSFYNRIIVSNKPILLSIMKLIRTDNKKAEEMIRKFFKEKNLDIDGRDNWFCYDIGDKLVKAAGLKPIIRYEE